MQDAPLHFITPGPQGPTTTKYTAFYGMNILPCNYFFLVQGDAFPIKCLQKVLAGVVLDSAGACGTCSQVQTTRHISASSSDMQPEPGARLRPASPSVASSLSAAGWSLPHAMSASNCTCTASLACTHS